MIWIIMFYIERIFSWIKYPKNVQPFLTSVNIPIRYIHLYSLSLSLPILYLVMFMAITIGLLPHLFAPFYWIHLIWFYNSLFVVWINVLKILLLLRNTAIQADGETGRWSLNYKPFRISNYLWERRSWFIHFDNKCIKRKLNWFRVLHSLNNSKYRPYDQGHIIWWYIHMSCHPYLYV